MYINAIIESTYFSLCYSVAIILCLLSIHHTDHIKPEARKYLDALEVIG